MKREVCKFLSGSFAGLAYAHAAYAVATSSGMVDEPVFLNKRWGVGYMWTEAVVYSAISLALGYAGWIAKPQEQQQKPAIPATDGNNTQPVEAGEPAQPVSR
jgi:hypothetical protein